MEPVTLATSRLLLDAVTPEDADAVFEYCQDPELQRFVPVPVPYARETATGYAGDYAAKAPCLWAIRDRDRRFMGVIELRPEELGSAELGFWLGSPFRGTGVMTEAVLAVVEFALTEGGFDRISWNAVVGNSASAIVARRAGLTFEGTQRLALVHRDIRLDGWFGSILRTEDRSIKPGWPIP